MSFHRGHVATSLTVCLLIAGPVLAQGDNTGSVAASGSRIPHEGILELFGDQVAGTDDAGEGVLPESTATMDLDTEGVPAGLADSRLREQESRQIKRPEQTGWFTRSPVSSADEPDISAGAARGTGLWVRVRNWLPLLVVLGLIAAAAWVVKRFLPARRLLTGSGVLEIVARAPLSSKQTLVLVKMGRRLVLVGVTTEQINALCLVEEPEQVATLLGEAAREGPASMTRAFSRAFDEESGTYADERPDRDLAADAGSEVRGLLEKVRRFSRKREVA